MASHKIVCPTEEQLAGYIAARAGEEHTQIHSHVGQCERCRRWLEEAHSDVAVFSIVQRAIREDHQVGSTSGDNFQSERASLAASSQIEGFEIMEEIGRGGMGIVYKARQKATKRDVALKVMLEGPFASKASKRRFEREVELAAQLDHPHVVTILESGIASGRYYFAMQYVEGRRLDDYVSFRKPSIKEVLRLFAKICKAVTYAHQRGVIHRDLKPSNILVDEAGNPHILDFGLAKVADQGDSGERESSLLSVPGQMMGTLPYMSPEQATGDSRNIDIRTDVYSLGVILYEMLTGRHPYNTAGRIPEVIASIIREDPRRPSTLNPQVGHEVETIVLKALSKDKERRYQSAGAFANDIQYYLAGEPIEAKRDSTLYILRKNLMRYRVPLTVAAAFILLLCVSVVVSWNLYTKERARADELRRSDYAIRLALAQRAYESNQISQAKSYLAQCHTELRGWEWRRLDWLSDRSMLTLQGHENTVTAVAFSPDGTRLVSASEDKTLIIWDVATGKEILTLNGHTDKVLAVAFSPDGGVIVSGGIDNILRVWDANSGMQIRTQPYETWITSVAFSSDGRIIAVGGHDAKIKLWDGRTGAFLKEMTDHHEHVSSIAFSSDGSRIVSGSMDRTVRIWNVQSGMLLSVLEDHEHQILGVAFSPNNNTVASAAQDHTVRVWDLDTDKLKFPPLDHGLDVTSVAFSPDGSRIITGCDDKAIRVWSAATGEHLLTLPGHEDQIKCVAVNRDGTLMASGGLDRAVKIWNTDLASGVMRLAGHWRFVYALACSPDGKRIATAGRGNTVRVWSLETGEELLTFRGHTDQARAVAFSPDGNQIVSAGSDQLLRLFDASTGEELRVFPGHNDTISAVAFTPDGKQIISGGRDKILKLFDTSSGEELRTFFGHDGEIHSAAVSRDGKTVISGSGDRTVMVWDLASAQQLLRLSDLDGPVLSVQFSPDGTRIVASSTNSTIIVWDATSGKRLAILPGHTGQTCSVAYSPDGRRIVSGGEDGRLFVWDPDSGQIVWRAVAGEKSIQAVAFAPDGGSIISAGMEMPIAVWESKEPMPGIVAVRHAVAEARRLVDSGLDKLLFAEEVIEWLQTDPDLDDTIRETGLRLARTRGDDPRKLGFAAWELVKFAGRETTDYQEGLRLARAARRLAPDNLSFRKTLGAALYRVGQYQDVLRTLCSGDDIGACVAEKEEEYDLVYIAMSLHNMGDARVAWAAKKRLKSLIEDEEGDVNNQLVHLWREVETLMEERTLPQEDSQ